MIQTDLCLLKTQELHELQPSLGLRVVGVLVGRDLWSKMVLSAVVVGIDDGGGTFSSS